MTTIPVEFQLLRDMQPRSRPSRGEIYLGEPRPSFTIVYPGAAALGTERMVIVVEGATRIGERWATMAVAVTIEGINLAEPRPGALFLDPCDIPSGVVHFPAVSTERMFKGYHSVLMRVPMGGVVSG